MRDRGPSSLYTHHVHIHVHAHGQTHDRVVALPRAQRPPRCRRGISSSRRTRRRRRGQPHRCCLLSLSPFSQPHPEPPTAGRSLSAHAKGQALPFAAAVIVIVTVAVTATVHSTLALEGKKTTHGHAIANNNHQTTLHKTQTRPCTHSQSADSHAWTQTQSHFHSQPRTCTRKPRQPHRPRQNTTSQQ